MQTVYVQYELGSFSTDKGIGLLFTKWFSDRCTEDAGLSHVLLCKNTARAMTPVPKNPQRQLFSGTSRRRLIHACQRSQPRIYEGPWLGSFQKSGPPSLRAHCAVLSQFHREHYQTKRSILCSGSSLVAHDALHRLFRAPSPVIAVVLAPHRMLQLSAGINHIVGVLQQQRGQVQARLCSLVRQRLPASDNGLVAPNSLRPQRETDRVCRRVVLGVRYAQLR